MAWEQLNAVVLNGNTYNLPKLTSNAFTWACNNYNILTGTKKKDFASDVRDGSQGDAPFRLTSYSEITTYNNQTFSFANSNDNFLFWAYTGSQVTPVMTGTIGNNSTNVQVDNFPNNGDAYPVCYGFAIDSENEIAFMWAASKNGYDSMYAVYIMSAGTTETRHLLYNDLMANQPVLYEWTSVPAISGKNGILSLAMINDADIGDGNPTTANSWAPIYRLSSSANLEDLAERLINNQEEIIIYSGDNFYMKALREHYSGLGEFDYLTLKFFLLPGTGGVENQIYSYRVTVNTANKLHFLGFIIDEENEVAAVNIITRGQDTILGTKYTDYNEPGATISAEVMHLLYFWIKGSSLTPGEDPDPLDSFEDNEGDGGGDLIDRINNPVPKPGIPYLGAYDTGFMSQWVIGKEGLKELSDFLWTSDFWENVGKFFNDPREIIMGLTISPVYPQNLSTSAEIKAGGITTGVEGLRLTKQFERYEMGSVKIDKRLNLVDSETMKDKKMGGIYFDYSPFTELKLYLPFCGEHTLDTSDCMGKTLSLAYTVDHISGICCAHLTIKGDTDECHYNFTGQMGVNIPLSSEDYSGIFHALLSSGAAIGGAIATIASGGMTAPMAVGAAANAISNISNMGRDVQYTSGGGSISGSLASEYPYITIIEPDPFMATNQKHYTGYPCFETKQLKSMRGYTKISAIHLDGLSCTEIERDAIRNQLSKGVIIQSGDDLPSPDPTRPEGEESLILLHNLSDVDTIGKKFEKDNQGHVEYIELTSKLLYNQDFAAVGLLVSEFNAGYNYAYIPSFGRVYYIDKITAESGAMVRYDLSCDAAESFWSELKECSALIDSTEQVKKAKLLVNNNTWYMRQKKNIKTLLFKDGAGNPTRFHRGTSAQDPGDECFIITIAGG